MEKRLTNKRLVKYLMDAKNIDSITITSKYVAVTIGRNFSQLEVPRMIADIGQTPKTSSEVDPKSGVIYHYLVFSRR